MKFDARVGEALRHAGDAFEPNIPEGLARVRALEKRRRERRRMQAVGAVLVAAAVVLAVLLVYPGGERRGVGPALDPDSRTARPVPVSTKPITVTRVFSAASLGLQGMLAVAVAPNGNLYVTDVSQTVAEVTPQGRVVRRWGGPGTSPGRFRMETGSLVVGRDGRVYVVDTGNFRVQVFSAAGTFLRAFGTFGQEPGQFLWPLQVAVDDQGDVYVADDRAVRVVKLSASGKELWRRGDPASTGQHLVGHTHFSNVDAAGRLVLANDDAGVVVWVDGDGREVRAVGSAESGAQARGTPGGRGMFPEGICDITTGSTGLFYVHDCQDLTYPQHTTRVFDPSWRLVGVWSNNSMRSSPRVGPHGEAWAIDYRGSLLELDLALE